MRSKQTDQAHLGHASLGRVMRLVLRLAWLPIVFLAVAFVARDASKYLFWSQDVYQRFWPTRWALVIHVGAACIALLIGPLQFSSWLRGKWRRVHRMIGWVYASAVIVSMPSALRLSMQSTCALCVTPFFVWGVLTLSVTTMAVGLAVQRDFVNHRLFMIRSYVLMYAFVIVRLDDHLLGTPLEVPLLAGVPRNSMVIWMSWVVPLVLTELIISWWPAVRRRRRA